MWHVSNIFVKHLLQILFRGASKKEKNRPQYVFGWVWCCGSGWEDEWRPQKGVACPLLLIFPQLAQQAGWTHFIFVTQGRGLRWGIQGGGASRLAFYIPRHFCRCPVKASEVHGHIFIWSSLMNTIYVHFICRPTKYPAAIFSFETLHKTKITGEFQEVRSDKGKPRMLLRQRTS